MICQMSDIDSLIDDAIPENIKKGTGWGISVLKGKVANFKFFNQASWGVFACCQQFSRKIENSPIGVNKLVDMMEEISLAGSLSKVYPNHCVRFYTISALNEGGIPIHRIIQISGHKRESGVESYCDRAWKSTKNPPTFLVELIMIPLRGRLLPTQWPLWITSEILHKTVKATTYRI